MSLAFYIARRYLFAKKSHNAINIISMISVCGVMVATIAMVCTLSVFNGFKGLTTTLFSILDPELKITPTMGKVFDPTSSPIKQIYAMPEVALCCETLQENALVCYGDRQEIAVLKGVDTTFCNLTQLDSAIIDGQFILSENMGKNGDEDYHISYAMLGVGLARALGVNAAFAYPLELYMPVRDETINIANPISSSHVKYAYIGGVYHINQPAYDEGFMLVPIELVRSMLKYEKEVSALEIKLTSEADVADVKRKIRRLVGEDFRVQDRYEQQEASFKMVRIEKWVTFLMLCFILVLALFNVLGSLAILMVEKDVDVWILRSMGADNRLVNRIFLFEGWMISLWGATIGVAMGILLCFLQQHFGLISLGETAGTFIVDAYPVAVEATDVLIVFATVVAIGFLAALYPVHYIGNKWISKSTVNIAVCLSALLLPVGCKGGSTSTASNTDNKEIAVTIEPLRYFAEKIAGDKYTFFSIIPRGQSPETYDPTLREMRRVGQSAAYLHIGQLFAENKLAKTLQTNQAQTRIFDLSEGMTFCGEEHTGCHDHDADEEDGHHHAHDPHIWTSFEGANVISHNMLQAFIALDPDNQTYYLSNYKQLTDELTSLKNALHGHLDTLRRSFVIYHPALTYLAEEFGLTQYSIEHDGKEPSPALLKELIRQAKTDDVKVVFVQLEFDRKYAEQIAAAIGARVIVINPLDYQWDKQIINIAQALTANGKTD